MKKIILIILLLFAGGTFYFLTQKEVVEIILRLTPRLIDDSIISPLSRRALEIGPKPLEKYTFENLKNQQFSPSEITFGKVLKDEKDYTSGLFYFNMVDKRVSGLANIPKKKGIYPIIVMFRGYVDQKIYTTGEGTRRAGEFFAANGFITLAPDFLGYGESASPSANSIEERFQTYTTALTLLSSLGNLNKALDEVNPVIKADLGKVGIWGHSNGGQIALSVLEISGKYYPTVLWAPVSKPFPYSILYYTDEYDDHGKLLRRAVADFEKDYDAEKYSPTNFFDWIQAPIQLHQGGDDEAVPKKWSDELVKTLENLKKDVTYFTYPGENHNFSRGSWPIVVSRSTSFYKSKLQ